MADTETLLAKLRANRAQQREAKDAAAAQSLAKIKAAKRQEQLISTNGKWHVLDGDTIEDRESGERYRLRGLNTRETNKPGKVGQIGGEEQKQQLYKYIEERGGELEVSRHGKDEYGRTIAEVYAGGDSINDLLVEGGAATYWDESGARKGAVTRRLLNYEFDPNHFDAGRLDNGFNRPVQRDHYYRTGDFKKAVMRGTDQSQAMLYAAADAVGSALGSEELRSWAQAGIEHNQQESAINPARVGSLDNIEDIDDFATYFVEAIGEQIPQLGVDLAAASTGAGLAVALGRRAAVRGALGALASKGAKAGGLAGIYSQTMGETQLGLLEEGVDAPGTAFGIGGLKAGLEYIGISSMLKGLSRTTGVAEGTLKQVAETVAQRTLGSSFAEATTEGAQTILDFVAVGMHKPEFDMFSESNIKELKEALAKGAIVGGTFRGVGDTAQAAWRGVSEWSGGDTQVEPTADVEAQARKVKEGSRTAVHLAANSPAEQHAGVSEILGENAVAAANSDGSTTYFADPIIAEQYKRGEISREEVLNYTQSKEDIVSPESALVAEVRDSEGNVVHSEAHDVEQSTKVRQKLEENLQPGETININSPEEAVTDRVKRGAPANESLQRSRTETQINPTQERESTALQGAGVDAGRSALGSTGPQGVQAGGQTDSAPLNDAPTQPNTDGNSGRGAGADGVRGGRNDDGGRGESVRGALDDGQTAGRTGLDDDNRGSVDSRTDGRQDYGEDGAQTAAAGPIESDQGRIRGQKESEVTPELEETGYSAEEIDTLFEVFDESVTEESDTLSPVQPESEVEQGDPNLISTERNRHRAYAKRAEMQTRYPAVGFFVIKSDNGGYQLRTKINEYGKDRAIKEALRLSEQYPEATFIIRPVNGKATKFTVVELATPEGAIEQMDKRFLQVRINRAKFKATTIKNVIKKDPSQEWQSKRLGTFVDPKGKEISLYLPAITSLGMGENVGTESDIQAAQDGFTTGVAILYENGYQLSRREYMFDKYGRFNDAYEIFVSSGNVQEKGITTDEAFSTDTPPQFGTPAPADNKTLDIDSRREGEYRTLADGDAGVGVISGGFISQDLAKSKKWLDGLTNEEVDDLNERVFDDTEKTGIEAEPDSEETSARYYDDVAAEFINPPTTQSAPRAIHSKHTLKGNTVVGLADVAKTVAYLIRAKKANGMTHTVKVYSKAAARDLLGARYFTWPASKDAATFVARDGTQTIVVDTDKVQSAEQQLLVVGHELGHLAFRKMIASKAHQQMIQSLKERYIAATKKPLDKQSFGNLQYIQDFENPATGEVTRTTEPAQRAFDRLKKNRKVLEKVLRCLNG